MGNFKNKLDNYQTIPRELIFDNTMSDRARFVFCYMASKPDNWNFYLEPMAKEIGYSSDTLRKYINELIAKGWLIKGEQQRDKGSFGAVEYTLLDSKEVPNFTDTEFSRHGENKAQIYIDNNNIKENNNKEKEDNKLSSKKKNAINNKFDVRADLSYVSDEMLSIWNEWLDYKDLLNKQYKTERGVRIAYGNLIKFSDNNTILANAIVQSSIEHSWEGFFSLSDKQKSFYLSNKSPYKKSYIDKRINEMQEKKENDKLVINGIEYK